LNKINNRFVSLPDAEKRKVETEVHRLLAYRNEEATNFLGFSLDKVTVKLVFRRYAGLLFTLCIDSFDNELGALESIHFMVEVLDAYFKNVCELDIVFNFAKMYTIVDELYLAGEIQEISKDVILARLREAEKLD
jgi:AP-2 complex subunit sigma-1